ncbi:PorT family protein [Crocinitomix sp.]|nr:PorT family protein [Crocinitomix sp.]
MKKLLSLILITGIGLGANAQDKKFQVGLVLGPTFNWTKIQTTKIERNGIGNGFTIGVGGNYMFNDNIGLASGIQFDLESFKLNYGSDSNGALGDVFYAFKDTEIQKYDEEDGVKDFTDTTAFLLATRKFRAKYVTIPIFLKFQTNMIGQFKYYGKFGLRTSFLAGIRMDDTGYDAEYDPTSKEFNEILSASPRTQENMKPDAIKKGLSFVRMGIGIYGGTEWNFTGNTFLYGEIGFNYGITPALYQKSSHLVDKVESTATPGVYSYAPLDIQNNPQHIIEIKIGLLF